MPAEIEIIVPEVPNDIDPAESEDFLRIMQYLAMREVNVKMEMNDIAAHFGVTRQALHKWIQKWTKSGLLQKCRMKYILPTYVEEIHNAHAEVMASWPRIVRRQIAIATDSESDKVANEAARWLHEAIVKPGMEAQEDPGNEEMKYLAEASKKFNPMAIVESKTETVAPQTSDPAAIAPSAEVHPETTASVEPAFSE